jgi:dipeptidyl aminopeptidase/acylaminoacyl peptidase
MYGTLTARAADANGLIVPVSFVWSSADPTIATVGQRDGSVAAVSPGSTTVTATAGTLTATATVSVRPPAPPVAVSISPSSLSLITGSVERLVAHATDSAGATANVSFEWSSADPAVATVGRTDGIVTTISGGATTVTVNVGTLSATATVSVVDFAGSFAFTRMTWSRGGGVASDVVFSSSSDRNLRSLPRPSEFASIAAPAWSPDGTSLAVEVIHTFLGHGGWFWLEYSSDLYIVDAAAPAASPWRALTTNGSSKSPSWSPNGRRIAYLEQDEPFSPYRISVIDADGGGAPVRLTPTAGYYGRPRWSPDGTRLTFSLYADNDGSRVFIVSADGVGLTSITPNATNDYDPTWSPDGAQLAFVRAGHVVVSDMNGSNVRRITSLADSPSAPEWSPDGRQIMFLSGGAVHVMNVDGSGLARLTTPLTDSWDSAPTWRP